MLRQRQLAGPPTGPFTLNKDSLQAQNLIGWATFIAGRFGNDGLGALYTLAGSNTWAVTNLGPAYQVDLTTGNNVQARLTVPLNPNYGSISLRFKHISQVPSATQWTVQAPPSGNSGIWVIFDGYTAKKLRFSQASSGTHTVLFEATAPSNDVDYHYLCTYEVISTTVYLKIYKNGKLDNSTSGTARNWSGNVTSIALGQAGDLYLYEWRAYERILTAEDAWRLYAPPTRYELYYVPRLLLVVGDIGGGAVALAGSSAGVATVTGALSASRPLATATNGVATVAGALAVARALSTASAGAASVSGALSVSRALATAPGGAATVAVALSVARPLASVTAGVAVVSGALTVGKLIAGMATGVAVVDGALTMTRGLAAQSAGAATVSGDIIRSLALVANVGGVGVASGALVATYRLATLVGGQGAVSGALVLAVKLIVLVPGVAGVAGALTVGVIVFAAERTFAVGAETRAQTVDAESRRFTVGVETRAYDAEGG